MLYMQNAVSTSSNCKQLCKGLSSCGCALYPIILQCVVLKSARSLFTSSVHPFCRPLWPSRCQVRTSRWMLGLLWKQSHAVTEVSTNSCRELGAECQRPNIPACQGPSRQSRQSDSTVRPCWQFPAPLPWDGWRSFLGCRCRPFCLGCDVRWKCGLQYM